MKNVWLYRILAVFNALCFGATVFINYYAVTLPLNGKSTGQLSDELPNLFVPAGITFSIWGVIYLLQLAFIVYQIYKLFRSEETPVFFRKIGIFYPLTCIFNSIWIVTWHYQYVWLSLVIMVLLLASLCLIYIRLRAGLEEFTYRQQWMLQLPFSVYLGWITVATVANVTAALVKHGWSGWGLSPVVWTIIVIAVCVLITSWVLYTRRDLGYAAVVEWALFGIIFKRLGVEGPESLPLIIAAGSGMVIILVYSIIALVRKSRIIS
ncbi:MAG: hypothetical protein A2Y33_02185 [Spirochaetes bacterium GWF1_51_8]|nr:MAG: hypothetical protein A2Y33_02185 [Spirochaetes bacterium GWF1_51_8]